MALTQEDLQMMSQLLDTKIQPIKDEIQETKKEIREIKDELQDVKFRVMKMETLMENEIRVNIQRVAEAHLDLSRKLNECIKPSNDVKDRQEIQDIYLNMHHGKLMAM